MFLQEFRFMRKWASSRHMIPENEMKRENSPGTSNSDTDVKSYFSLYLEEGNPFDRPSEEEEREDVFSGTGVRVTFLSQMCWFMYIYMYVYIYCKPFKVLLFMSVFLLLLTFFFLNSSMYQMWLYIHIFFLVLWFLWSAEK